MQQQTEHKTWATLKTDAPFLHLFPDGRVPVRSPIPIIPREEGAPLCYLVAGNVLSDDQVRGLADLLWQQWQPECESIEQAIAYIRGSLPLRCDWFMGVSSTDFGLMMSMAEAGEELRETSDDYEYEFEDDEDW